MPMQLASRASTYRPSDLYGRIAAHFLAALKELGARSASRRSMGDLSDRLLKDAGLIRHDLDAACAQGLSQAAASHLKAAARCRSGNW